MSFSHFAEQKFSRVLNYMKDGFALFLQYVGVDGKVEILSSRRVNLNRRGFWAQVWQGSQIHLIIPSPLLVPGSIFSAPERSKSFLNLSVDGYPKASMNSMKLDCCKQAWGMRVPLDEWVITNFCDVCFQSWMRVDEGSFDAIEVYSEMVHVINYKNRSVGIKHMYIEREIWVTLEILIGAMPWEVMNPIPKWWTGARETSILGFCSKNAVGMILFCSSIATTGCSRSTRTPSKLLPKNSFGRTAVAPCAMETFWSRALNDNAPSISSMVAKCEKHSWLEQS